MPANTAIYINNSTDKHIVLQAVFSEWPVWLSKWQQNGLAYHIQFFSQATLQYMLNEERQHGKYPIISAANKSLQSMSSGQQKIALFQYQISLQPQRIILDDWSGSLDTDNQLILQQLITEASVRIEFIQLFYRKQDILPFVENVLVVNNDKNITTLSKTAFLADHVTESLPPFHTLPQMFNKVTSYDSTLVEFKIVNVAYESTPVLQNINWQIKTGEFWQLKGANGSGKTTIASIIIGDNPKGYGQNIFLFGRKKGSGESVWDVKKNIGYFYPAMCLFFTRNETVQHMIISGFVDSIGLYEVPTTYQQQIAQQWINLLGIQYYNKRFNQLSPGQQRIILVVRALVKMPPLLILDEPTAGLDDENIALFTQLINAIAALKKIAIIYITHRKENNIQPHKIFELIPTPLGSVGNIIT
jgi:molybdate transport system ATP-binding protein